MDVTQIIPYIDGGTEGFKGQVRVVIPRITPCFECSLDTFPPPVTFQLCTIAETPRKPEHCIAYAMIKQWEAAFPGRKMDKDSPEDMKWIYERAAERAATFGIDGVTYSLTMGVVKSIIPAIASTNALISAACVGEALKLVTFAGQTMSNYYMYMGQEGLYTLTQALDRKDHCPSCSVASRSLSLPSATTLQELIDRLKTEPELQLTSPSLFSGRPLYVPKPEAQRAHTTPNLAKPLSALIGSGDEIAVHDPVYPGAHGGFTLTVTFSD